MSLVFRTIESVRFWPLGSYEAGGRVQAEAGGRGREPYSPTFGTLTRIYLANIEGFVTRDDGALGLYCEESRVRNLCCPKSTPKVLGNAFTRWNNYAGWTPL